VPLFLLLTLTIHLKVVTNHGRSARRSRAIKVGDAVKVKTQQEKSYNIKKAT